MRCGSLVDLPVDRLGFSDILISFLLFRTQSAAADGTRTPTRTRWLESTSVEQTIQSTSEHWQSGHLPDATFEYEYHFVEYEYEYDQGHPFLNAIIPDEPYFTLLFDLLV